jgi:hypothetical protein
MISISHKAKQLLVLLIKLLIVGGAFYFIYNQLAHNDKLNWVLFVEKFNKNKSVLGIALLVLLSVLNRFFEILKWQNLVSFIHKITLFDAAKQVLGALTAGLFTPNGIGEYAGKALFFEKSQAKNIVFLNLICNGIQVVISILFGLLGLWYLGFGKWVTLLLAIVLGFGILGFGLKKVRIKGYSIEKILSKINEISKKIHRKNSYLAVCRYLIFSHQYYLLFLAFDVQLPYFTLMATIATVYFLASSLPTFQFLDFAVKGSVAVYFFGLLNVNEWIVVFVSTLMWFLNVVLPVLIGSYFVLNFKSKWKT